ncbi:MAG: CPBP family intramembrane metalloprotease [Spirulina sp. SIO3F2]|nr:CPBP family intramembrane metalloprotease [Spirulina sp. SIO3F2]
MTPSVLISFWQILPGWTQLLAFVTTWLLAWLPIAALIALALGWRPGQALMTPYKLSLLASLYLLIPPLIWGVMQFGSYTLPELGLRWHSTFIGAISLGLGLGVLGLAIVFALETRLGWVQWHPEQRSPLLQLLPTILLLALWISLTEEVLFRGLFVTLLQKDAPFGTVTILTSALFAASHLLWERDQTQSQLAGLWLMGMVLVLARLAAGGDLSLAIGLHAGWIWGLTCLDEAKIMTYSDRAPVWWVGRGQQPLAGAAGIFCLWGTALVLVLIGFRV